MFSKSHFTSKQDIFSFAMTMYFLIFGGHPFEKNHKLKLIDIYTKKIYHKRMFVIPESFAYSGNQIVMTLLFRFIEKCMSVKESIRPEPNWSVLVIK